MKTHLKTLKYIAIFLIVVVVLMATCTLLISHSKYVDAITNWTIGILLAGGFYLSVYNLVKQDENV